MRRSHCLFLTVTLSWGTWVHASVTEREPNSPVTTGKLIPYLYDISPFGCSLFEEEYNYDAQLNPKPKPLCTTIKYGTYPPVLEEYNISPYKDEPYLVPGLVTPLSLTDEIVGQLSSTRDYDWYYVDISDSQQQVTPVYFSCDKTLGYYYENFDGAVSIGENGVPWQIQYYYDPNLQVVDDEKLQGDYLVYPNSCKRGDTKETKGPFRFQMNTSRTGRYYIRVWGSTRGKKITSEEDIVTVKIEPVCSKTTDNNTNQTTESCPNTTDKTVTKITEFEQIIVPTSEYSLRLYTARVGGELEPNDGIPEAYKLTSGVSASAQLSSMYDQDWFYIDNNIEKNKAKKLSFYFSCRNQTGSLFFLSAYNAGGVLQTSYEVPSEKCNGSSGFSFSVDAPVTSRYYFSVTPPTYTETAKFTQANYSVLVLSGQDTSVIQDEPVRRDGDLEPSERPVDAFPLPKNTGVTAQVSNNTDLDWFSINYTADTNNTGVTTVTFDCKGEKNNSAAWELATYNPQNAPQSSYTITAAQCTATGGFRFPLSTPTTGKYFVLVNAKADTTGQSFSQSNYTLNWNPVTTIGGFGSGTVTRINDEPEPNDTPVNAFPLVDEEVILAQLGTADDVDYYYYENDADMNPSGKAPVYFGCNLPIIDSRDPSTGKINYASSNVEYVISYFNAQGILQKSYAVTPKDCSTSGTTVAGAVTTPATSGFTFTMQTPTTGKYYILVSGPTIGDSKLVYTNTDYTLSTTPIVSSGNIKTARILDTSTPEQDSFNVVLKECDSDGDKKGKGTVKLSGSKLNLTGVDASTQVRVQIGQWSCVSDTKQLYPSDTHTQSNKGYVYPKPVAPTPPPPARPQITGGG